MQRNHTFRLLQAIRAVVPAVQEVRVGRTGNSASVAVTPAGEQGAAQATIDAFDWSDAAHDTWKDAQEPSLKNLRDSAVVAAANIDTYLTVADTATAVQVREEVKAIDRRQKTVILALLRLVQRIGL